MFVCKKSQNGLHNFPVTGADCLNCGINQKDLSYPKRKTTEDHLNNILHRGRQKNVQATYHQQLAVETAKMLGDMKSLGIYLRLFKKYDRTSLIECRNWVLEKGRGKNLGRLFVSVYKKFL